MKPRTLLGAIAMQLAGCSCMPLQIPGITEACGSVVIAPGIRVTAGHCPTYGEPLAKVPDADLQFVSCPAGLPVQPMQLAPTEAGTEATLRGKKFVITDPLRLSDGHLFLLAWPELEHGDSGFGLWQGGKLIGVAIGNDGEHAVFVAAGEIARVLKLKSHDVGHAADPVGFEVGAPLRVEAQIRTVDGDRRSALLHRASLP